ncbi:hypothetical protein [Flavobacterium sp. I-STPA6A]|uniref:hypothetical protein n=1 Tax=Flavobacterium sp. I-STPA6A TaxID=2590450 RepID=UPI00131ACB1F|nr:hypothetical protein [Flavobacterium sp. I-STPA6A]
MQGSGTVTIIGAGITFIQKNLVYTTGDTFFLEKTDTNTWVVEGNVPAPTVVIGNVYIHASAGFGNDSTAQLGNPARPFLTLSAAMSAAESNNLYRTFIFMTASSGPYYMNGSFGAGQYTFYSDFPVIISLQNNALSGLIMTNSTDLIIDIPTGTVDFRSTIVKNQTQLWGVKVSIKCRTYIMNDGFIVRGNPLNLICEELIHHGGFLNPSNGSIGGIIKANTITSTTAGISDLTQSGDNFILDFNQCTTTNGLVLAQYCRSATINHGNYTCGSSATFTYVVQWHPNAVITINYKGDCLVSGNVRLSQQIANQILKFTGCVTYTGTVPLFYRVVGLAKFFNCQIKCAVLTTQFFVNNYVAFEFTNCYIECGYDFLDFSNVGPMTFTSPIARFKGNNVVYMTSIPQNYIKASSTTNNMIIEVIGNLRTNGILQPGVTQSNLIT